MSSANRHGMRCTIFFTVVKKELLDALRDSKSMATAFLLPIFFAAISLGSMYFAVAMQKTSATISLPIQGSQYIAPLIAQLEEAGIQVVEAPADPEQAIRDKQVSMVLIVPETSEDTFRRQAVVELNLLSDHSRSEVHSQVNKVKGIISQWSAKVGALRLLARNVAPDVANPIQLRETNVTGEQRLATRILGGLPMFIFLIAIVSGIGMTADMASGERERRTLEPLLINPVSHTTIFLGKWLAAVGLSFVIAAMGIGLQFIAVNFSPLAELGLRISLGWQQYFMIVLILIPIIFFAISLQLSVSFLARSFKDAQSYNSLITMLPMLPGFYLMFYSSSAETWQMFVPVLGAMALVVDIISGEPTAFAHIVLAAVVASLCAVLCAVAGVWLLRREKTLFT